MVKLTSLDGGWKEGSIEKLERMREGEGDRQAGILYLYYFSVSKVIKKYHHHQRLSDDVIFIVLQRSPTLWGFQFLSIFVSASLKNFFLYIPVSKERL